MEKIYDFDKPVCRRGTNCVKYDALRELYGNEDLIPLWVADMDFETPDFVVEAMRERLEHPVFGYTVAYDSYWQSIQDWLLARHSWHVEREWMRYIPGIVKGIGMVINALTEKGDKVIIQPPIYHPFRLVPEHCGREVVFNPLRRLADGSYEMDFDHLESIIDSRCKILILSNPHNPAGIVWSRETLIRLAEIADKHNLVVISDEIHCDMTLYGHCHTPFATVSEAAAHCSITFGAPSKTFNIAGLQSVPESLTEAAKIDGATSLQTLIKVKIPMIMQSVTICVFLTLTNSFKLFDQNMALTNGEPMNTTTMLALNIYKTFYNRTGPQWKGLGQAKAVIFCILVVLISFGQLRATRSKEVQQ